MPDVAIHAAWSPGEVRIAVMAAPGANDRGNNGGSVGAKPGSAGGADLGARQEMVDYALWRPGSPDGVGDVYGGRVSGRVAAMAGAFVVLPGATEMGFLPDSEGAKDLTEGAIVMVRVTRAAQGGKGPRLSARGLDAGTRAVGLLSRGIDPFRELAARYPQAPVIVDDPALAASLRAALGDRLRRVTDSFGDAIETEVERIAAREVVLGSGARLSVYPTPALVAIDVDGGGALADGSGGARMRHRALNAAILPDLARQIRLRNLSGAILVDLAGLKAKQRNALGPALAAALAGDPARPRFLGFTALGLAEIARPRIRAPLHEAMTGPLAAGLTALRAIARAMRADPGRRLTLRATPSVLAALEVDATALADLARIAGAGLNSRSDPSLPGETWRIEAVHG